MLSEYALSAVLQYHLQTLLVVYSKLESNTLIVSHVPCVELHQWSHLLIIQAIQIERRPPGDKFLNFTSIEVDFTVKLNKWQII